jgi:membrane protein
MRRLLDRTELRRVVVARGDSSVEVASALDVDALAVVAGLGPGAPPCRAWSRAARRDGREIVFKGADRRRVVPPVRFETGVPQGSLAPVLSLTRLTIRRARQERLAQAAGSLTFTTVLSIVPLLAVSFALFTRFPIFRRFETAIEEYLLKSLLPAEISRTVLQYLRQFAENASGLTLLGSLFVLLTAVALLLTVENALNRIWQVRKGRPILRRVGLYLVMLAIGPPALGVSLWATSYVLAASIGALGAVPPSLAFVLNLGPVLLSVSVLATLFRFVPNTRVRWRDALVGGLIAGIGLELGKRGFAAYLLKVPTYKAVYGAFAAFPVFLMWVYFSWLVTLTAALIAANLARAAPRPGRRPAAAR